MLFDSPYYKILLLLVRNTCFFATYAILCQWSSDWKEYIWKDKNWICLVADLTVTVSNTKVLSRHLGIYRHLGSNDVYCICFVYNHAGFWHFSTRCKRIGEAL